MVSRDVLLRGFEYGEMRVSLLSQQGIFKPRIMELPLSITTSPNGPYNDEMGADKCYDPHCPSDISPAERGKLVSAAPVPDGPESPGQRGFADRDAEPASVGLFPWVGAE